LQDWLAASAGAGNAGNAANASTASNNGTLEFLLRRMRHKSDFPAMSDSVVRIQRVAASEKESLGSLSNEILKDVALTNKLLRMVNTAHYQHAGGGSISTVSRAIALVGFAGIRNMALSLVLLAQPLGGKDRVGLGDALRTQRVHDLRQFLVPPAARAAIGEMLGQRRIDRFAVPRRQIGVEKAFVLQVTRQGFERFHDLPPSRPRSLRTARNRWTRTVDSLRPVIALISRGVQSP